jgi:superfamily II DNA or RNA helicase
MGDDDIWDQIENIIDSRVDLSIVSPIDKSKLKPKPKVKFIIVMTREGTYIENLSHELSKKIQNYFTLSDKNIMGYFTKTPNWERKGNKLYIPKFGSLLLKKKFAEISYENKILPQNPLPNMTYLGKFNGNQKLIFDDIVANKFNIDRMQNGKAGLILNLDAGQGKTFLAMSIIGYLKCRTLVVTHNSSILDQWVKLLTEYFPNSKIGQYYGKKKIYGDIVVGVINSLVQPEIKLSDMPTEPEEFYKNFDLVILDEAHEYCSKTRSHIYKIAQCPYMLGLSATPHDRLDSLDKINHWGIGSIYVASDVKNYTTKDIAFTGQVTKVCYSGPNEYTESIVNEANGLISVPLMIGSLCDDPYRLDMIVELTLEQHRKKLDVLVFADRRSYLETIRLALEKKSLESQIVTDDSELASMENKLEAMRLVGGSSSADMALASKDKTIILSTYQYFGTGCSVPRLNAVILATPRKSKSRQFIGRIFRIGSDYSTERQIIDVVDTRTTLKNQWYERKKYYDEKNYTIIEKKISWKEYE